MKDILLLDGSTGAMLTAMGMPSGVCVEKWALDNPDCIRKLQNAYIDAGSDIIYTPTFGANEITLGRHGLGAKTESINASLARITRKNVGNRAKVYGDMSPTGEMLFPMGTMTAEKLCAVYARQAKALEPFVDGFVCETFMSLAELRCAYFGVRSVSDKPVITTLTVDANARTMCGDALVPSLITMQSLGVAAFGVNCVSQPEEIISAVAEAVRYAVVPFVFKPNAGIPVIKDSKPCYSMTPECFASVCEKAKNVGVRIFGGCCGTSPDFIRALAPLTLSPALRPEAVDASRIAATSREFFSSIPETQRVVCDDELSYAIEDGKAYEIFVPDEKSASALAECEMLLSYPPVFDAPSRCALEAALRAYNGRAYIKASESVLGAVPV